MMAVSICFLGGRRHIKTRIDAEHIEARVVTESIAELLSGPKDSVTMFASCGSGSRWSRSKFRLDASGSGDPLDLVDNHMKTHMDPEHITARMDIESVEELLSGQKDSVTMFASRGSSTRGSRSKFRPNVSGVSDPLDLLALEVQARGCPDAQPASGHMELCETQPCFSSHAEELAWRCRRELHKELDLFLNGAALRQDVASKDASSASVADTHNALAHVASNDFQQMLDEKDGQLAAKDEELDALRQQVSVMGELADHARREYEADLESAHLEAWALRERTEDLYKEVKEARDAKIAICAGLADAQQRLEVQAKAAEAEGRELRGLRGDRDALRALPFTELAPLVETLSESLLRVQREYQRRFEQRNDEQLCVVCLSERKNVVLQPCHHLTMCASCFEKCHNVCPQCRAAVQGHLVIYT